MRSRRSLTITKCNGRQHNSKTRRKKIIKQSQLIARIKEVESQEGHLIKSNLPKWKRVICWIFGIDPKEYKTLEIRVWTNDYMQLHSVYATTDKNTWMVTSIVPKPVGIHEKEAWEVTLQTVKPIPADEFLLKFNAFVETSHE